MTVHRTDERFRFLDGYRVDVYLVPRDEYGEQVVLSAHGIQPCAVEVVPHSLRRALDAEKRIVRVVDGARYGLYEVFRLLPLRRLPETHLRQVRAGKVTAPQRVGLLCGADGYYAVRVLYDLVLARPLERDETDLLSARQIGG